MGSRLPIKTFSCHLLQLHLRPATDTDFKHNLIFQSEIGILAKKAVHDRIVVGSPCLKHRTALVRMNILVPRGFRQVFAVLHNTDVIASNHSPPSFLSPINNVVCFSRIIIAFKQKIKLEIVKFSVFFVKFAKLVLDSIKNRPPNGSRSQIIFE